MSIYHNGKEYGARKVINYSASPDYNRGVTVDNIQSGNYQATDNGFLMIQLQSQQSNPTKVSVVRNTAPITDTGTEIASIVISQYQYSETLVAQVMARDYYKLVIEGAGNPQVISCMFYPYASNVPIKLIESIGMEQVEGLENELGNYVTDTELALELNGKQDKGNYFDKDMDKLDLSSKVKNILDITHGGTGRNDGLSRGVKNNVIRNENNWKTDNTRGFDVFYWQTANSAKLGLPTTAGVMISNVFTDNLKSFLALNLSPSFPELRIKSYNSAWKMLAFNDDVVNKMPKVSKNNGIGYLQQIAGQGVQVTYRLPSDGTYFYFLTCTNDYNNYNAVDNKAGIAEGGSEIISASMNKKTFGGFIWRIQ